jgi:16S rRNA (cytidine1402-2'-O)-methyltransferase
VSGSPRLYLIPVPIGETPVDRVIPAYNLKVIRSLKHFVAEDAKTARRFLKAFGYEDLSSANIELLNVQSKPGELQSLLEPLKNGNDLGLMSDAGCPGIADPGADLVRLAHNAGISVQPLSGPSSIMLSIMASGFNGQNFAFVGYLPVDKNERSRRLKELEQMCIRQKQAQFFIETPYRNEQLFEALLQTLSPSTLLYIGKDLSSDQESARSMQISEWKRLPKPSLHKVPVVFGIYSA